MPILTFLGGFHPQTQSLWLTDMAHHHLAIAVVFILAGHMYRTNFGIGHTMQEILDAHTPPGGGLGAGHKGLFDTVNNSLHFPTRVSTSSRWNNYFSCGTAYVFIATIRFLGARLYYSGLSLHTSSIHCWLYSLWRFLRMVQYSLFETMTRNRTKAMYLLGS